MPHGPRAAGGGGAETADRWRLAAVCFAVLLAAADTYVVVVVLPDIMNGVGVSLDELQRATPIISGFLLGYTVMLPLVGKVADLTGTGPVLAGCLFAFAAGSLVTATAHSLPVAVLGRAVQGFGGGGLVPVALSMVASSWAPDERGRPLGLVGAVQELGSVAGPLYGAGIVALASWRAIFWLNLPLAGAAAGAYLLAGRRKRGARTSGATKRQGRDWPGPLLAALGACGLALGLDAPTGLASSPSLGTLWSPLAGGSWAAFTTPVVLASLGVLGGAAVWEASAPRSFRPLLPLRQVPAVLARSDLPGAGLLAAVLACIVVAFSTADPSRQIVSSSAPVLLPLGAALAAAFFWRQRRAVQPLIDPRSLAARPAWGGLAVNVAIGAGLMAALVDVPLFARSTVDPSSEVAAASVLLRFLVAVPVGALVGGLLCRHRGRARSVAGAGMALAAGGFVAMSEWSPTALGGGPRWSDAELVVCGLGFGLAIAPVNVAILGAVDKGVHALASALAVVARTVGMLAGLSALAAVGLRRFYEQVARIPSPLRLCPSHPESCPAYDHAATAALISELHSIFFGAAITAALAAALAVSLLGSPTRRGAPPGRAPSRASAR